MNPEARCARCRHTARAHPYPYCAFVGCSCPRFTTREERAAEDARDKTSDERGAPASYIDDIAARARAIEL